MSSIKTVTVVPPAEAVAKVSGWSRCDRDHTSSETKHGSISSQLVRSSGYVGVHNRRDLESRAMLKSSPSGRHPLVIQARLDFGLNDGCADAWKRRTIILLSERFQA
jgi:hypothetical protein